MTTPSPFVSFTMAGPFPLSIKPVRLGHKAVLGLPFTRLPGSLIDTHPHFPVLGLTRLSPIPWTPILTPFPSLPKDPLFGNL